MLFCLNILQIDLIRGNEISSKISGALLSVHDSSRVNVIGCSGAAGDTKEGSSEEAMSVLKRHQAGSGGNGDVDTAFSPEEKAKLNELLHEIEAIAEKLANPPPHSHLYRSVKHSFVSSRSSFVA